MASFVLSSSIDMENLSKFCNSKYFISHFPGRLTLCYGSRQLQLQTLEGTDLATLLERVRLPLKIFECELNILFLLWCEKAVKLDFLHISGYITHSTIKCANKY